MNYYQQSLNAINGAVGASNWPRDLEAAKRGEGDFGVPMPTAIMKRPEALINLNRAKVLINEIQYMLDNTPQDPWDSTPMRQIIGILQQTKYAYEVFIAELDKVPVPEKPSEDLPDLPDTPQPTTGGGIWDWVKANPIPVAIGAGLLVNFLLPKNKRFIKF